LRGKTRTVEAIAAGTLNITFIIELRFKIIKIVARRFAKNLERERLKFKKTSSVTKAVDKETTLTQ
jgi:hypothetical protein